MQVILTRDVKLSFAERSCRTGYKVEYKRNEG